MSKEEIFENINKVIYAIITYNETRSIIHFTNEDVEMMIGIWEKGIVKTNVSRGCSSCVKHVADVIYSYYEREYPTFLVEKMMKDETLSNADVLTAIAQVSTVTESKKVRKSKKKDVE